jgi:acetyl esterase
MSFDQSALKEANDRVRKALAANAAANFQATVAALREFQLNNDDQVTVTRDLPYGPHPRHKFDWFTPAAADQGVVPTVLIFVHGGGFVGGDKREAGTPFYDNIGNWAAVHGLHAAILTYRLAPQHPWPAGGEDVRSAIAAVRTHARQVLGVDARVYVMGHSAGAVHAAAAVTMQGATTTPWANPTRPISASGPSSTKHSRR